MDYNEKKKFVGKIAYIILSIMTVTILCITVYTFIGSFKQSDTNDIPLTTSNANENEGETDRYKQENIDTSKSPSDISESSSSSQKSENISEPSKEANADVLDDKKELPANNSFAMPVEGVVFKLHDPDHAVYSLTMGDYRIHSGIDIEAALGNDVVACAYGTVKSIYTDPFEGKCVVIDHGNGVMSYYKNLSEDIADGIKEGVSVNQGQSLGTIGETASIEIADSPHLHFEITVDNEKIDPLQYLPLSASTDAKASISSAE